MVLGMSTKFSAVKPVARESDRHHEQCLHDHARSEKQATKRNAPPVLSRDWILARVVDSSYDMLRSYVERMGQTPRHLSWMTYELREAQALPAEQQIEPTCCAAANERVVCTLDNIRRHVQNFPTHESACLMW